MNSLQAQLAQALRWQTHWENKADYFLNPPCSAGNTDASNRKNHSYARLKGVYYARLAERLMKQLEAA